MVVAAKALAIWLVILATAVANGGLREAVLIPWLGKTSGLVLSGLLLCALVLVVTAVAFPWFGALRPWQPIGIGLGWLLLTLGVECSLGRLQGKSWPTLLAAYTFKDGNLWPLVLLVTAAAPYVVARFRGGT